MKAVDLGQVMSSIRAPGRPNTVLWQAQEKTLEPELPICDPHHHFWDFRTARILGGQDHQEALAVLASDRES